MAQGLKKIATDAKAQAAARAARDQQGDQQRVPKVALKEDMESAIVRFTVEEPQIVSVYLHQLPKKPGQAYGDRVQCMDQADSGSGCPACDAGSYRSERLVIPCIWQNAPKLKRDEKGWIVKDEQRNWVYERTPDGGLVREPIFAIWDTPISNASRLLMLAEDEGGGQLTPHYFRITRRGAPRDKNTTYDLDFRQANAELIDLERKLYTDNQGVDPRSIYPRMGEGDMQRAFSGDGVAATSSAPADNIYTRSSTQTTAVNVGAFQNK
jgi:hypothetical protein